MQHAILIWRLRAGDLPRTAGLASAAIDVLRAGTGDGVVIQADAALPMPARTRIAAALPDAVACERFGRLQSVAGCSTGSPAPWHYVVETDVRAGQEADFNAWYAEEHLPGLAAVPGVVLAARYRRETGDGPRYRACYDLASIEAFNSPPWLAVRGTAWSDRVRPAFFNTTRTMYRRPAIELPR